MARPYSYDPDKALEAAMHVFWRDGYDLASLSDLQQAMGIQRGSVYKEFGSKKGLFLKALERYVAVFVEPGITLLNNAELQGKERIETFFASVPDDETRGCLLCNTAAGAAGKDSDVRGFVMTHLGRLREAFQAALSDDLADKQERIRQADRLTQQYIGQRVEARAGGAPKG